MQKEKETKQNEAKLSFKVREIEDLPQIARSFFISLAS